MKLDHMTKLTITILILMAGLCACGKAPATQHASAQPISKATPNPKPTQSPAAEAEPSMDERFMAELLKLKQREGRDNALIHYVKAGQIAKFSNDDMDTLEPLKPIIKRVLSDGWDDKASELLPLLQRCQPAFPEIRQGTTLNYAKNIGVPQGMSTPVPQFLAIQTLCQMLCVQGRLLESQGKDADALDHYLLALTMGRDFGARGATMIGALISKACLVISTKQITRLAASGHLDRQALGQLQQRLQQVRESLVPVGDALSQESQCFIFAMEKIRKNPDKMAQDLPLFMKGMGQEVITQMLDKLEADNDLLWHYLTQSLQAPFWQRDPKTYQQGLDAILAKVHPFVKISVPNVPDFDTRYQVATARLEGARLAVALELFKLDRKSYPATLSELIPGQLNAPIIDPFTGQPFRYRCAPGGAAYTLWSVGPDRQDSPAAQIYDPSNGTVSVGDITFTNAPPDPTLK